MMYNDQTTPSNVIETASATTSPDNVNSGNRAYIIVAASLVGLMLLSTVMGGCVSMAVKSLYYLVEDDIIATNWDEYLEDYNLDEYGTEYDLDVGHTFNFEGSFDYRV